MSKIARYKQLVVDLRADLANAHTKLERLQGTEGHSKCSISTGIDGSLTAGWGELDANGYFEKSCGYCALRANAGEVRRLTGKLDESRAALQKLLATAKSMRVLVSGQPKWRYDLWDGALEAAAVLEGNSNTQPTAEACGGLSNVETDVGGDGQHDPDPVEIGRQEYQPKCADCGAYMNEGEAKCFTVCSDCWDKHYGRKPVS